MNLSNLTIPGTLLGLILLAVGLFWLNLKYFEAASKLYFVAASL